MVRRHAARLLPLLLLAGLLAPTDLAAAEPPPITFVTMHGDTGHWVGGGQHRLFHDGNATISVTGTAGAVTVRVSGGSLGDAYDLEFAAPPGQRLAPGHYDRAQRAPFREDGRPGIDVSGDGRGCNTVTGRFTILDIAFTEDGAPASLWLTYEHHCDGGLPALYGEVRWAQPPAGGVVVAPQTLWLPDVHPGAAGTVTPITVLPGRTVTFGTRTARGPHPGDFRVREDTCSGRTVAAGASCTVWVRFTPSAPVPRHAELVLAEGGGGERVVQLDGVGSPGRTRFWLDSDPDDYIGQGRSYRYDPTNATIGAAGGPRGVSAGVNGGDGDYFSASLTPADGDILLPGTYEDARRFSSSTNPGLDVTGSGRGCNASEGSFTVTHATYRDGTGELLSFGATFTQHCEGGTPALRGTVEHRVPDTAPRVPGPVGDLAVRSGSDGLRVTWSNPSADHAVTLVRLLPGRAAVGHPSAGLAVYGGTAEAADLPGFTPDRDHTVTVFPIGPAGEVGAPRSITVGPDGTRPSDPPVLDPGDEEPRTEPAPDDLDPADPDSADPDPDVDAPDEPPAGATRLAGPDRIATAVAISRDRWADGAARVVVLARADTFADALAGTPLAIDRGGPLLLTDASRLAAATEDEIARVLPDGGDVLVLGGAAAVGEPVLERLRERGHRVDRIAGRDRYATAAAIALRIPEPTAALLASGTDFPDALAAGAAAGAVGGVVLLTAGDERTAATDGYLAGAAIPRIAIGGPAARAHPEAEAISGPEREATAVAVARRFHPDAPAAVGLSRSDGFADALTGGAHVGAVGGPVLLTSTTRLGPAVAAYLCTIRPERAYLYGGTAAIDDTTAASVGARSAGEGC
jgi:hypothetical protein